MHFGVLGLDHHTATLPIRSQYSIAYDRLAHAYEAFNAANINGQCVILSTCNRFELYYFGEDYTAISNWLHTYKNLSAPKYQSQRYHYKETEAIDHCIRVACGLKSMVMGEPEIFGQLKKAYARAKDHTPLGTLAHQFFQGVFKAAKAIRTQTAIGRCPVSFGCTALRLLTEQPETLRHQSLLLIGAGQTIQLIAKHLHSAGIKDMHIVNRTLKRAQIIAQNGGGKCHELSALPTLLPQCDIVISAISLDAPIISLNMIQNALRQRKQKPLIFLDMGVPRNIAPEAEHLDNITLYCVDDVDRLVNQNTLHRTQAATHAQALIAKQVSDISATLHHKNTVDSLLKTIRTNTEAMADKQLNKALALLDKGHDPSEVMKQLTENLTNQWLYRPSTQLNKSMSHHNPYVLSLAQTLFTNDTH